MATLERPYHLAVVHDGDIHLHTVNGQSVDMRMGCITTLKHTHLLRDGRIACINAMGFMWIWDPKKPLAPFDRIELFTNDDVHIPKYVYQFQNDDLCYVYRDKQIVTVAIVNMTQKSIQRTVYSGGVKCLQHLSDGRLASVCEDGRIYIGDVRKGTGFQIIEMVDTKIWVYVCTGLVALSNNRLACQFTETTTRNIYIYDFDDDKTFFNKLVSQFAPEQMARLNDNELIVSKYDIFSIWNLEKRTFVTFVLRGYFVQELYGVNKNQILFECRDPWSSVIHVWDWTKQTGPEIYNHMPVFHRNNVKKCGWLPNGSCYILAGNDTLVVHNLQNHQHTTLKGSSVHAVHTLSDDQSVDKIVTTELITYFPRELCNMVAMYI